MSINLHLSLLSLSRTLIKALSPITPPSESTHQRPLLSPPPPKSPFLTPIPPSPNTIYACNDISSILATIGNEISSYPFLFRSAFFSLFFGGEGGGGNDGASVMELWCGVGDGDFWEWEGAVGDGEVGGFWG